MNTITVQQLIDALNKVENKSLPVNTEQFCFDEDGVQTTSTDRILSVYETTYCVRGRDYMGISKGIILDSHPHAHSLVTPNPLNNTPAHRFLDDLSNLLASYEDHLSNTPIQKQVDEIETISHLIADAILPAHPRHA